MKTVLFLAFLALGPALAQQVPIAPVYRHAVAVLPSSTAHRLQRDQVSQAVLSDTERARLCGGGT